MRKSSNKSTERTKTGARAVSQSEGPEESPHSRPKRIVGILKGTAEFVAAVLAVVVGVHDAIQKPQIHAEMAQTSAPVSLYFSLHNPSLVLPMGDVRIECFMKNARTGHGVIETSFISVPADTQNVSIPPGETIQSSCPLDAIVTKAGYGSGQIAEIQLVSKFKTLSIERNTYSEWFNWEQGSRQWTEGKAVN